MLFNSRLCEICQQTLQRSFENIDNPEMGPIAHHATKDSLIDSVLRCSCHLCRFIVYHFRANWAPSHRKGVDDLREEPTTLTKDDFKSSDFDFEDFPKERRIVQSYLLDLPERLNLRANLTKYGDGSKGVYGIVEFTCNTLNEEDIGISTQRFWVFDEEAFGGPPTTSRLDESTSSSSCQVLVMEWLTRCNKHNVCNQHRQPFVPTRLLDISEVGDKGSLRLVLTEEFDLSTRYVTLSHCWGGNVPFQLKSGNLETMMKGFKLEMLPKTFRDAITVAGWAQVDYIWIDSCCIIQDSSSDWEQEARMMKSIYNNTFLNISADHSPNNHGGCFIDRLAYKITPSPFEARDIGEYYLLPQFNLTNPLTQSIISERAWVIQERFLSPRILHFTTDQLFWECASLFACETFPKGMPHVYDNSTSRHYETAIYTAWGRTCEEYSRAKLTYTSDKLIAFAGIVGNFQSRLLDDNYLAGLWRRDLITGMLWKAMAFDGRPIQANGSHDPNEDPLITAAAPGTYRAPSWSWLSKDVCIFWQTKQRYSIEHLVTILDANVDLKSEMDPAGDICGGQITLRGFLRAAQWTQEAQVDAIIFDGLPADKWLSSVNNGPSHTGEYFQVQRDTGLQFSTKDIFCLPIRLSLSPRKVSHGKPVIEGLILGITEKLDRFERLGHFECLGETFRKVLLYEPCARWTSPSELWNMLDLSLGISRVPNDVPDVRKGYDCDVKSLRRKEQRVISLI